MWTMAAIIWACSTAVTAEASGSSSTDTPAFVKTALGLRNMDENNIRGFFYVLGLNDFFFYQSCYTLVESHGGAERGKQSPAYFGTISGVTDEN